MKPDDSRRQPPGIEPHDPRLSEWIDGRLTAAEAAEVERAVAAAPELTRIVADLRAMKQALAAAPAASPPAGFARDVLAAIEAAGRGPTGRDDLDDAEVEAEWRKLERARIDEEIAEAREDAADLGAAPMRQRWPWLALAGSLAAGVIVAFLINRPGSGDREVAMTEAARQAAPVNRAADEAPAADAPEDSWTPEEAEPAAPAEVPPGASRLVTVRIRDAKGRQRLGDLLAASGLETKAAAREAEEEQLASRTLGDVQREGAAEANRARAAGQAQGAGAIAPEQIEVSGPPEAIAALAVAIEALAALPSADRAEPPAAPALARAADGAKAGGGVGGATGEAAAAEPATRLVILVVDEFGADPAEEARPEEEP